MNDIKCPQCGAQIKIDEALTDQVLKDEKTKHAKELAAAREQAKQEALKDHLETEKHRQAELEAKLEAKEASNRKLQEDLLQAIKQNASKDEENQNLRATIEKEFLEQKEEIRKHTLQQVAKENDLKFKEKDKIISDLEKLLSEAERKASQRAGQLKGETLELSLEDSLREHFRDDLIEPVAKGVKGADVVQHVKTRQGISCGTILWEAKRTKNWSDAWLDKLKDDMREAKAHIPVIVTTALPANQSSSIFQLEGVWVVEYHLAIAAATLLRSSLLKIQEAANVNKYRATNAEGLYNYITGHNFRHRMEAVFETYQSMLSDISKERNAYERLWAKREGQINKIVKNMVAVIGDMEGEIGSESLPKIRGLELPGSNEELDFKPD